MPPRSHRRLETLRAAFDERGIRPRPRLGQNFLLDRNQVRFIARQGEVVPGDLVLEVGPGTGFLTRELLEAGARVLAVELDTRLADYLEEEMADAPGFELIRTDILAGKNAIAPAVLERLGAILESMGPEARLKCVSNLPYSAGTPFVANLFSSPLPWKRATVLLQLEVAERLLASPGQAAYGSLSIGASLGARGQLARRVPPQVFWPRPRVASAVVTLDFLPLAERETVPWRAIRRIASAVFGSRRKTLPNALKGVVPKEEGGADALLEGTGIDPARRGETLTPQEFHLLGERLAAREE
jgi:16S rRNA (adenine1518-N6/adenine1519-N6)-dimethyltransferase